jgi:hypothetical protein
MVKAVKRKPEELGYGLAEGDSLKAMTPKEIKLMNAEFEMVASNKQLAERAIKVRVPRCSPCRCGPASATAASRPVPRGCGCDCGQLQPAASATFRFAWASMPPHGRFAGAAESSQQW